MYEQKALLFAEKYGVIEYQVIENEMIYFERWHNEGAYKCIVNLDTMKEKRTLL